MRKKMCPTTQPCDLLRTLALLITVLLISYPAQGQVGSISAQAFLCGSNPNGSDLTVNTSNNTVWTIDSTSGSVCVFNSTQSPAALTLANTIDHPVGPAVAPLFQPQCSGIAYSPASNSFWILNSTSLELVQMNDQGVQIGTAVPFAISGSASGLAYDFVSGNLWTRDTVNQMAVELDPQTCWCFEKVFVFASNTHFYGGWGELSARLKKSDIALKI